MAVLTSRPRVKVIHGLGTSPVLPAPGNLVGLALDTGNYLTWDPVPSSFVGGYLVWRRLGTDGTYAPIADVAGTTFLDNAVTASTEYWYKVQAYDQLDVAGIFSAEIQLTSSANVSGGVIPASGLTPIADWSWRLALSHTMVELGELDQGRSKTLSVGLNKPGNASVQLPIDDDLAMIAWPLTHCIIVYFRDTPVWSGPILTIEESVPDDHVTLNAVGWFELLNHRFTRTKLILNKDAGQVAHDLLDHVNDPGAPIFITKGTIEATQLRQRTYERLSNVGAEIQALADLESGYDWSIDPKTRKMNVHFKRGVNKVDQVAFGYGFGVDNISSLSRQVDGSGVKNRIFVTGKTGSLAFDDDTGSRAIFGTMEASESLSDVQDAAILGAYLQAELVFARFPFQSFQLTPKAYTNDRRTPRLFIDYDIGDIVKFNVRRGRLDIRDQAARIFGATLNIDDNGVERVTNLQLTYDAA